MFYLLLIYTMKPRPTANGYYRQVKIEINIVNSDLRDDHGDHDDHDGLRDDLHDGHCHERHREWNAPQSGDHHDDREGRGWDLQQLQ